MALPQVTAARAVSVLALVACAGAGATYLALRASRDPGAPTERAGGAEESWREFRARRADFDSEAAFYSAWFASVRAQREAESTTRGAGIWFDRAEPRAPEADSISALGYVGGYRPAPPASGLMHFVPERAQPGLNLYVSGHAAEALLADLSGTALHRWSLPREVAFPDLAELYQPAGSFFRRTHLLDDGDLLALYDYLGLVRLGPGSELRWARGWAHHDFTVADGRIWVLGFAFRHAPEWNAHGLLVEDYVDVLTLDGALERRIALRQALERSGHSSLLGPRSTAVDGDAPPTLSDPLHSNALRVLDGSAAHVSPHFAAGNLLISMRNNHTIAILDPRTERIVWARSGPWRLQHDPTLLPNGRLLVFDNEYDPGARSRVVELDPFTAEVHWQFAGDSERPFYSVVCGGVQRLPNGNTLVTDSASGRAFELTAEQELVWAWISPHTAGAAGERIALLPQLERIAAASVPARYSSQLDRTSSPKLSTQVSVPKPPPRSSRP